MVEANGLMRSCAKNDQKQMKLKARSRNQGDVPEPWNQGACGKEKQELKSDETQENKDDEERSLKCKEPCAALLLNDDGM